MDLTYDRSLDKTGADLAERPAARSLSLALRRMGFRPRPDRQPQPQWPRCWRRHRRDEASSDWRPL